MEENAIYAELLSAFAAAAAALAAVLAWLAKLRWSREYAAAKDETIRAKEAQIELLHREIESLRELTPMKIREYFISVKQQLEEYNDSLETRLSNAGEAISEKDDQIRQLEAASGDHASEVEALRESRRQLEADSAALRGAAEQLLDRNEKLRRVNEVMEELVLKHVPRMGESPTDGERAT